MAQLFDLIIDIRVFFDIGIRRRHISLRLVVIIIADKILYRVLREELLKLPMQLRRQRLMRGNHQRRLLPLLDQIRHREGLAGPRHAHQSLIFPALRDPRGKPADRLRLVAHHGIV